MSEGGGERRSETRENARAETERSWVPTDVVSYTRTARDTSSMRGAVSGEWWVVSGECCVQAHTPKSIKLCV